MRHIRIGSAFLLLVGAVVLSTRSSVAQDTITVAGRISMDWNGYKGKRGVVREGFNVEIESAVPNGATRIFKGVTDSQGVFVVTDVPKTGKLSYKNIIHLDFCNKGCASANTIFTPGTASAFVAMSEYMYVLSREGDINFKWIDTWDQARQAIVDKATRKYVTTDVEPTEHLATLEIYRNHPKLQSIRSAIESEIEFVVVQKAIQLARNAPKGLSTADAMKPLMAGLGRYPANIDLNRFLGSFLEEQVGDAVKAKSAYLAWALNAKEASHKVEAFRKAAAISKRLGELDAASAELRDAVNAASAAQKFSVGRELVELALERGELGAVESAVSLLTRITVKGSEVVYLAEAFSERLVLPDRAVELSRSALVRFEGNEAEQTPLLVYLAQIHKRVGDSSALDVVLQRLKQMQTRGAAEFLFSHYREEGQAEVARDVIVTAAERDPESFTNAGLTWFEFLYGAADGKALAEKLARKRYELALAGLKDGALPFMAYAPLLTYLARERSFDALDELGQAILARNPGDRSATREMLDRLEAGELRNRWLDLSERQLRAAVDKNPTSLALWSQLIDLVATERSDVQRTLALLADSRIKLKDEQFGRDSFEKLVTQPRFFAGLKEYVEGLVKSKARGLAMDEKGHVSAYLRALRMRGELKVGLALLNANPEIGKVPLVTLEAAHLYLGGNEKAAARQLLAGVATSILDEHQKLDFARLMEQAGASREALPILEQLLNSAPKNTNARFLYAKVLEGQFRFNDALREYRQCVRDGFVLESSKDHLGEMEAIAKSKSAPDQKSAALADRYLQAGEIAGAKQVIDRFLAASPMTARIAFVLGRVHEEQRELEKAKELFERSLALADNADLKTSLRQALQRIQGLIAIEQQMLSAQLSLGRRQYDEALTIVQKIVDSAPGYAEALFLRGQINDLRSTYDKADATKDYEQALKASTGHAAARTALRNAREYGEVLKKHKTYPNDAENVVRLATMYRDSGRIVEAEAVFRDALKLAPNSERGVQALYNHLVNWSGRTEKYKEALELARRLERMSRSLYNRTHVAWALMRNHEYEASLALADAILRSEPNFAEAINIVASAYSDLGKYGDSEKKYLRLIQLSDTATHRSNYGITLARAGRHWEAIIQYRRALSINPGYFKAKLGLINAYLRMGDYNSAEPMALEILARAPTNSSMRWAVAHIFLSKGKIGEALDQFRQYSELEPESGSAASVLATAFKMAGDESKYRVEADRALSLARSAMEKRKSSGEKDYYGTDYFGLVVAHGVEKEYGGAVDAFKRNQERYKDSIWSLAALGWAEAHAGELKKGLEKIEVALKSVPNDSSTLYRRAWVLAKMGEMEEAKAALSQALRIFPTHLEARILQRELSR